MPDIWMDVDVALGEVPVNIFPLTDDTDFKTREESVTYDQAGLDLVWNFCTTGGAVTQTAVAPTTGGGSYGWTNEGNGMYAIEVPDSGGASINNDTEGFGWFTGYATGILPWRGPVIGFRAAGLNNVLIDSASSATRGLSGTALPDAAADAAGGLPISDDGGLDLDTQVGTHISSIVAVTSTIGATGTGLSAIPWNADWDAEVESEAADALIAINLDHLCKTSTAGADMTTEVADNTIFARILANGDTSAFDPATDGLQPSRDNVGTASDLTSGATIKDNLIDVASYIDTEVASIISLLDDARGEPGQGAPPVNPDLATKIDYLYKAWRNQKTQTSETFTLFADDASTADQAATVSDADGTATFGEMGSGA